MKCPMCGDAMLETDPECLRCAGSAGRGVSLRRVRAERLITLLLALVLLVGVVGLTMLARRQPPAAAQGMRLKQSDQEASSSAEADDSQAAKQDAQGDQSTDE